MALPDAPDGGYQPGPRVHRHVIWGGLSLSQITILGGGGVLALAVIVAAPLPSLGIIPLSFIAGLWIFAFSAVAAFIPVAGLLVADWTPQAVSHTTKRARKRTRWRSPAYGNGVTLGAHGEFESLEALPAEFGDLEIMAIDCPRGPAGMIHDRRAHTLCGGLRVHLRSLGLLGREDQIQRYAAFGRILDSLALETDPDFRLQLLKRVVPRRVNELSAWLADHVVDPTCQQARDLYDIAAVGGNEREHELFIIVRQGVRSAYRARERSALLKEAGLELVAMLDNVDAQLRDAEISLGRPDQLLDDRGYARLIKDQIDPFGRDMRDLTERETGELGLGPTEAWPDHLDETVKFWRADSADHVGWWIKGWPSRRVQPGWLKPLMLTSSVILNVSLVMKPFDAEAAMRRAGANVVSEETSRRTRQRAQQVERTEHQDRQQQAEREENELAAGYSPWRWEANLSASVPIGDQRGRQDAIKRVKQACARSHLKPVLMHFHHERTVVRTLPLARGLRDR